jgi:hypothetical protein
MIKNEQNRPNQVHDSKLRHRKPVESTTGKTFTNIFEEEKKYKENEKRQLNTLQQSALDLATRRKCMADDFRIRLMSKIGRVSRPPSGWRSVNSAVIKNAHKRTAAQPVMSLGAGITEATATLPEENAQSCPKTNQAMPGATKLAGLPHIAEEDEEEGMGFAEEDNGGALDQPSAEAVPPVPICSILFGEDDANNLCTTAVREDDCVGQDGGNHAQPKHLNLNSASEEPRASAWIPSHEYHARSAHAPKNISLTCAASNEIMEKLLEHECCQGAAGYLDMHCGQGAGTHTHHRMHTSLTPHESSRMIDLQQVLGLAPMQQLPVSLCGSFHGLAALHVM